MKTIVAKMAMSMILIFAGVLNANLNAENKYITNDEVANGQIVSKTIYINDGKYLHQHIKYNYTYNDEGTMTEKEAFKWNTLLNKWVPYFKMNLIVNQEEYSLNLARWNPNEKDYTYEKERAVYAMNEKMDSISYKKEKWNSKQNKWKTIDNMTCENKNIYYAQTK